MTHNKARQLAISKIAAESHATEARIEQLGRMNDWDLANVFWNFFWWDWQDLIECDPKVESEVEYARRRI